MHICVQGFLFLLVDERSYLVCLLLKNKFKYRACHTLLQVLVLEVQTVSEKYHRVPFRISTYGSPVAEVEATHPCDTMHEASVVIYESAAKMRKPNLAQRTLRTDGKIAPTIAFRVDLPKRAAKETLTSNTALERYAETTSGS